MNIERSGKFRRQFAIDPTGEQPDELTRMIRAVDPPHVSVPGQVLFFFYNDTAPPEISPLPLHAALPIWDVRRKPRPAWRRAPGLRHLADRLQRPRPDHRQRTARPAEGGGAAAGRKASAAAEAGGAARSEEHTSELQSRLHLVCRLLLEKK